MDVGDRGSTDRYPVVALDRLTEVAQQIDGVRRDSLQPGDRVLVATRNSIYALVQLADGRFEVTGGIYQRRRGVSVRRGVLGCSAGGRALMINLIAAPGLYLELDDGTRTTRIRRVEVNRRDLAADCLSGPSN